MCMLFVRSHCGCLLLPGAVERVCCVCSSLFVCACASASCLCRRLRFVACRLPVRWLCGSLSCPFVRRPSALPQFLLGRAEKAPRRRRHCPARLYKYTCVVARVRACKSTHVLQCVLSRARDARAYLKRSGPEHKHGMTLKQRRCNNQH